MRRAHPDDAVLITSAPESPDDEYDRRRRRYAIMMASRAVCVILAALTYRYSSVLALACLLGGAVLPWCAVILANDRPPKRRARVPRLGSGRDDRALPAAPPDHPVVEG
jgi:Protein of unknown function (DUF3099)